MTRTGKFLTLNHCFRENFLMRQIVKLRKRLVVSSEIERQPVTIVGDAAIATKLVGHGCLVPLVIFDADQRPDLREVIEAQAHLPSGDVSSQWATLDVKKTYTHFALILTFVRPVARVAIVEFEVAGQGIIVEQIFQASALYIQAGKPGDRVSLDSENPKILVQVPETGARKHWEKIFKKAIYRKFRNEGLKRAKAKTAVQMYLEKIREVSELRI